MFGKKKRTVSRQNARPKPAPKAAGTSRVKASLLSLESRLMFDAAAAATAAEVNQERVAQEQAESALSAEGGGQPTAVENESQELLHAIATYYPGESRTEIVFVDPTVLNYQELLSGMDSNITVIMLDGEQDGVEQMASALAGRTGIDAIHLISHGGAGELQLGTSTLTTESMTGQYADELAIIQRALSGQADILVYGCDFADGQVGQEAATLLSQLTGADVAASTDATGFAAWGGDWVLETQIGTIEAQIAVDAGIQASWVGLLAAPVVDLNAGGVGNNVTTAFTEQTPVLIAPVGTLSDVDSANLNLLTVTLTARPNGNAVESLSLNGAAATVASGAGLTVSYTASTGVLLISGTASTATYQTILQGILYNNTSDQPTTSNRSITVVARDSTNASSTSRTATVTVTAVNDAPVLADTVLSLTVAEDAGVPSGAVGSLLSTFTAGISDVDSGAVKGIAITGSNQTNGIWYYTRNGGTTWTAVGTVSNTSALLLADNASTRLYFAPNANYNGTSTAALTLRAWDQTSGTAGTKVTTASNGGTTAFSSATDTVDVTVTAVNDAPTITSLSGDSLAYSEGAGAVVIEQGNNALVADVDSTNLDTGTLTVSIPAGGDSAEDVLSIRHQGTGAGQIGVSGSTVTYQGVPIGTVTGGSSGSSLVITFNVSATPTAVTALVRNITYQNTDTNAPTTGARTVRFVLTDGDGGTSPNYNTTVTVSAVNDAPVLADTALSLTVMEDAGVPSGAVGSLLSTFTAGISDVDSGAVKGIAITGSNQTNGIWYYTRNGGTTWTAVGTVSNTSALLLADNASTRLYFAPNANYNGTSTAALTLRAWDQTSGTAGTKVTTASNGGTTAFSSATDTVDVTVTAVNDAPTITSLSGDSLAYSEGAGAVVIEQGNNALVADVDSTNLDTGTLTVSIPAGGDSAEDVLSIRHQGTGAGQIGVSGSTVTYQGVPIGTVTGGSSGSSLVITFNVSATPTAVTALVRNITYQNTDTNAPTTGARTVRFVLTDGDGGTSPNYNTTVTVSAVNDAPVLADTALSLTVMEDAGVPSGAVGSLLSTFTAGISDVDSGAVKGIAITGSNQTNGIWYYTRNGGTTWTAVGTVSNTSALLLADNASTRLYFAPNANYNGTSTAALTLRAWDQTSGTAGTKVTTASNGGTTAFSSATDTVDVTVTAVNDAPTDLALLANSVAENAANGTVVGLVTGTDPDSGDTASYSLLDTAGGRFAINSVTGELTVANSSLLDYESATSHTVTVRVTDAGGLTYDETFTINLTNVNEAPTDLALSANSVAENAANGTVVGLVTGTDPDSGDTASYSLLDTAGGRFAINSVTGELTVANSSLLDYESATSHTVTVRVTDAGGLTYDETFTINLTNVNEAPTDLALSANSVAENAANGTVVGLVTGTDPDSGDTQTYSLLDTAGGRFAINSVTGELTVANSSLLDYESATSHTVTVRVTDAGGLTYDETFTINLTNVNETPNLDGSLESNTVIAVLGAAKPMAPVVGRANTIGEVDVQPLDGLGMSLEVRPEPSFRVDTTMTPAKDLPPLPHTADIERAAIVEGMQSRPTPTDKKEGIAVTLDTTGTQDVVRPQSHNPTVQYAGEVNASSGESGGLNMSVATGLAGMMLGHGRTGMKGKMTVMSRRLRGLPQEPPSDTKSGDSNETEAGSLPQESENHRNVSPKSGSS